MTYLSFGLRHIDPSNFALECEERTIVRFSDSGRVGRLGKGGLETFGAFDLLRWGVPFALAPQGHVVLHASAVLQDQKCYAVLGIGGAGKSTLAHELAERGWRRIADDFLLCNADGLANVLAESVLRSWCMTAAVHADSSAAIPYRELARRLDSPASQEWVDLSGILFLEEQKNPAPEFSLIPLDASAAFRELVEVGFGGLPTPDAWEHQFDVYAALANKIPTARLQVPDGLERLRSVLTDLEASLSQWRQ